MKNTDGYIVKKAVDITEIEYEKYGILFNLSRKGKDTGNTNYSKGSDWEDVDTAVPLLDTLARIGYTCSRKLPFLVTEMEKHAHTQEAQIPCGQPLCFCVAKPSGEAPGAEDIVPVIVRPGYVFVLHREVWHSASHGVDHDGSYYWMAQVYENEPTVWSEISGKPVYVEN